MELARIVLRMLGLVGASAPEESREVVISAAPQFAPTSFARARLLRQLHACGLLCPDETGSSVANRRNGPMNRRGAADPQRESDPDVKVDFRGSQPRFFRFSAANQASVRHRGRCLLFG